GDRTAFALYVCAIIVSAFFGGLRGGGLATGLASLALVGQYTLLPEDSPRRSRADFAPSLGLLIFVGLLARYLTGACARPIRPSTRLHGCLAPLRDAVLLATEQGQVASLNRAAQALTGWQNFNAVDRPLDQVLHLVEEDSRQPIRNI